MFLFNVVMEPKKISGIRLPETILGEYQSITERVGEKQNWMVGTAAIIALVMMTKEDQDRLIEEAGSADVPDDGFIELLKAAKSQSRAAKASGSVIRQATKTTKQGKRPRGRTGS